MYLLSIGRWIDKELYSVDPLPGFTSLLDLVKEDVQHLNLLARELSYTLETILEIALLDNS